MNDNINKEFYINPFGKIVKLKGDPKDWVSIHSGIASEVIGTKNGSARDKMIKLGWIAWGSPVYGYMTNGRPTQAQINTVFDLGFIMDESGLIKPIK